MKVTYTLKDLSDHFYNELKDLSELEVFNKLKKYAFGDLKHHVKQKIGSGAFRDAVELNQIMRNVKSISYKIEPRRGYNLAIFEII